MSWYLICPQNVASATVSSAFRFNSTVGECKIFADRSHNLCHKGPSPSQRGDQGQDNSYSAVEEETFSGSAKLELQPIGCGGVQVCAPIYKLVMTNLGGEQRFAAAVARRLQSLGALTRGDRRAASGVDLSESNFDSPLGRKSLRCFRTLLSPYAKTKGAVVLSLL